MVILFFLFFFFGGGGVLLLNSRKIAIDCNKDCSQYLYFDNLLVPQDCLRMMMIVTSPCSDFYY